VTTVAANAGAAAVVPGHCERRAAVVPAARACRGRDPALVAAAAAGTPGRPGAEVAWVGDGAVMRPELDNRPG
jgi:hypothetical protein